MGSPTGMMGGRKCFNYIFKANLSIRGIIKYVANQLEFRF